MKEHPKYRYSYKPNPPRINPMIKLNSEAWRKKY